MKDAYTVHDVIAAEINLQPMVCLFCGSNEVDYNQYLGDAYCGSCGLWQLEEEEFRRTADNTKFVYQVFLQAAIASHWSGKQTIGAQLVDDAWGSYQQAMPTEAEELSEILVADIALEAGDEWSKHRIVVTLRMPEEAE